MKPFKRSDRVSGLIRKKLSEVLQKEIRDPRLDSIMITGVKVSTDLKLAKIYFVSQLGSADRQPVLDGFEKARGFIKRALAGQLGLRYMPDLKFFYDDSFDYGERIEQILKRVNTENGSNYRSVEE
jgi:ribosome-binding factor A